MALINENYQKLAAGYLFPEIARRVKAYTQNNPQAQVIRMGIGDVVLPLPLTVREAIKAATDEMGTLEGFRGYGPEQGYEFLRQAIANDYKRLDGLEIDSDEIFVSDGSKCDSGNIQEIFSLEAQIAVTDPVYPVYVDTNVMAGRTGIVDQKGRYGRLNYISCTQENSFIPSPPSTAADIVYLCSPNNPTGTVIPRSVLESWVSWARKHKAIILFDAAYEAFITEPGQVHSIFEIPGARECAIELRSFSKNGGFTGIRCAYMVIPKNLMGHTTTGTPVSIHALWSRRHSTKFNGVAYPIQKGTAALYSEAGKKEIEELIKYYLANAQIIRQTLSALGLAVYGGINAPFVWAKTPEGTSSWDFFDTLLHKAQVVVTPGSGFGACGEGYFRVSAFALRENVLAAMDRIKSCIAVN